MHNDQLKEMEDTIRRKEEDLNTIKAKHDSLLKLKDEELKQLKILHDNHVSKVHERHEEVVQNMQEMHEKTLELSGVGFRANLKGNILNLQLGFSHDITYKIPDGIKIVVEK